MINKKNLCIIPARGGSKGIKKKNLSLIDGKTLLQITIENALSSNIFDVIHVSTDDSEIKQEAEKFGIEFPFMRSEKLANDNTHVSDVVSDVILKLQNINQNFINVCLLMPTSPLRTFYHLREAYGVFEKKNLDSLVSISPLGKLQTNLRYCKADGLVDYFNANINRNENRQNTSELFAVNGSIYISKVSSFLQYKTFHTENVFGFKMNFKESIDINTPEDLKLARIFYKMNHQNNLHRN